MQYSHFERLVKYRTMVWWKAAALMLAETVSLGVRLSPNVINYCSQQRVL